MRFLWLHFPSNVFAKPCGFKHSLFLKFCYPLSFKVSFMLLWSSTFFFYITLSFYCNSIFVSMHFLVISMTFRISFVCVSIFFVYTFLYHGGDHRVYGTFPSKKSKIFWSFLELCEGFQEVVLFLLETKNVLEKWD